ncbi:MAG TPA: TIGR01777 family oxidoreductase, partial [Verrucomicrobiae bacterium]
MNILLSGASGLVGTTCSAELRAAGHDVRPLKRGGDGEGLPWDVSTGRVNLQGFAPDALIHLAGENIAGGKWTEERMKKIRASRVDATRELCDFLSKLEKPPQVMLSASAIGIYGPRGDKWVTEQTPNSTDFLGELCYEWEKATVELERVGCRVVHMRFGIILSPNGGALKKMLPAFKMALGGPMGDGAHWMSWIALEDVVRSIAFLLDHAAAHGPINIVTPNPVT